MFASLRRFRSRPLNAAAVLLLGLAVVSVAAPASGEQADEPAAQSPAAQQQLPGSFQWSSSGPLISPAPDINSVAAKDPSVVQDENGTWHVFFTKVDTRGDWGLAHTSFTDWSQAAGAPQTDLEADSAVGPGYRAAPHAFYFEPTGEWYLVYQTGLPSFSTTTDPNDPSSWSAPRNFMDSVPDIVQQNIGNGNWLDFYVICDDAMCYLFSADDNGHVYRSETTVANFPNGFGNTQIVLEDSAYDLFEGGAVYRVGDTNTYLLIWEAIGSDGRRWYRSFTAEGLTGQWTPLADTENNPFARSNNVTFDGGNAWTRDISHGELVRATNDQTMTIDPCNLQLLYQGMDPSSGGDYSQLPWRLGLATSTTDGC
ncbi:non-reducing end alpha-L-arabinofuranosidase family hydrolase [Streptomyces litchfieldiae]|uniref:non-reducing end alpha-L-arabinofuranosidase n=1 Tax=Streptomyces litchfieldiae TaxID=3075543 RepID=A0ABU2N0I6_9ACTN|nr:non-reducing end alpha-L-arabinofuranosidase family hydrolase [Streptomyces sp. DSM 44938]MDT0347417.1 non-reducing end alpha-L-arabinofuranosidase family hydrolase [Streptomyces sp. DSM 44938]